MAMSIPVLAATSGCFEVAVHLVSPNGSAEGHRMLLCVPADRLHWSSCPPAPAAAQAGCMPDSGVAHGVSKPQAGVFGWR